MLKLRWFAVFAFVLGLVAPAAAAQTAPAASSTPGVDPLAIIQRIVARNPSLRTFQTRVHVNVRMLNFPFLAPQLDGTAYYKRPDDYEIVFDRVPSYAHGITKLFGDVGDPAGWVRDCDISYDGVQSLNNRPYFVLSMTKKIHSDQLKQALAYVDASTYQVARMEWQYYNGGSIVMTQWYKTVGDFNVISQQHADIHIPHVRAVADALYGDYHTNIAVDDSVFTKK